MALFFSSHTGVRGKRVPVPLDIGLSRRAGLDGVVSQYWVLNVDPTLLVYDLQVGRRSFHAVPGEHGFDGIFTVHYENQELNQVAGPVAWPNWYGNVLVTKQNGKGEMVNLDPRDVDTVLSVVGR
jgi:hypothetical protein